MTSRYEPIGELDLYAYADGLLEGDAVRRTEIERYLASDPDAAAHVAEIRAQNREIREAFGDVVARPVPDRMMLALEQGHGRRRRRLVAASAAFLLVGVAAGTGWLAGERDDRNAWALEEFAPAWRSNTRPAPRSADRAGTARAKRAGTQIVPALSRSMPPCGQTLLLWSLRRCGWRLTAALARLATAAHQSGHEKQAGHEAGWNTPAPEHGWTSICRSSRRGAQVHACCEPRPTPSLAAGHASRLALRTVRRRIRFQGFEEASPCSVVRGAHQPRSARRRSASGWRLSVTTGSSRAPIAR